MQNLPGGVGPQKNDSIWIDIGMKPFPLPGNRWVKPLVAPLILPLNALIDVNSHGNAYGSEYHGFRFVVSEPRRTTAWPVSPGTLGGVLTV